MAFQHLMIEELEPTAPCKCDGCDSQFDYEQLKNVGGGVLTPGSAVPAGRCPQCDALAYPLSEDLEERATRVLERATRAFWGEVAKCYPEASTGDLSPWASQAMHNACGAALDEWREMNLPREAS